MIRNRLTALTLLLGTAAFGAACDADRQERDTTPATEELEQPPAQSTEETLASGDFEEPDGAVRDVDGEFELRSDATGSVTLMVSLEGLTPGEHAWHIHEGECGTDGPVTIALTPAPDVEAVSGAQALTAGADGRATATVTIPQAQLNKLDADLASEPATPPTVTPPNSENAPVDRPATATGAERKFSIRVHERGGTEHGPTMACANLDASKLRARANGTGRTY